MSDKYNDGVLDERFKNILDKLDDQFEAHTKILGDIKGQTTATNGKVAAINAKQERQDGFNSALMWVFGLIIVPVIGVIIWQVFLNAIHLASVQATLKTITK